MSSFPRWAQIDTAQMAATIQGEFSLGTVASESPSPGKTWQTAHTPALSLHCTHQQLVMNVPDSRPGTANEEQEGV